MMRVRACASASILLCSTALYSGYAYAQTGADAAQPSTGAPALGQPTVGSPGSRAAQPATSAAPPSQDQPLAEIIVTAQRRSQRAQDVPIAINVISGAMLARTGVATTEDLAAVAPGFNPRTSPGGFAPSIRGVGSLDGTINAENAVPVYVDGVYYASAAASALALNNVERVEVLKGPQGTLFGRNAAGGLVSVITKTPSQDPETDLSASYANYDTVDLKGYITAGLADHLAFDVAGGYRDQHDGWGTNLATGQRVNYGSDLALRSKLLFTPTDKTSITLEADYSRRNYDTPSTLRVQSFGPDFYDANTDVTPKSLTTYGGGSVTVSQDLSFTRFLSISAYHQGVQNFTLDGDETPIPAVQVQAHGIDRTFTQEIQFQSLPSSKLNWIVGGFYMDRTAGYEPITLSGLAFAPLATINDQAVQDLHSYSGFAQATYPVLPATNLTLGARFTSDHVSLTAPRYVTMPGGPAITISNADAAQTFDKVTYRASLDHRLTSHALVYVSYNTGFKGGQYNLGAPGGMVFLAKPQTNNAVEGGIKSEWLQGKLRLNLSAFHYDEKNVQVIFITTGIQQYVNAGTATITGLDFEGVLAPIRGLELRTGFSYLPDANYGKFGPCPNPDGISDVNLVNCNGQRVIQTPKLDLTQSVDYHADLGSAGSLNFDVTLQHTSSFHWDAFYRYFNGAVPSPFAVDAIQPTYNLLNASLQWTPSHRYSISVWGKNLTNKEYTIFGQGTTAQNNKDFDPAYQQLPGAPRTYGVTLTGRF